MEKQLQFNWIAIIEEAKQRRKAANLTQERLAILANVSTPTVSRFEGGEKDIQLSSVLSLLKILGMTDERTLRFEEDNAFHDPSRDMVIFFAYDGEKRIRCEISREALIDFFGAPSGSTIELLRAFNKHRKVISHKIYMKFLKNEYEADNSIIVRTNDLV